MPDKEDSKKRKRMIVEEVATTETPRVKEKPEIEVTKPDILEDGAKACSTDVISDESMKPIEKETAQSVPEKVVKQKSPVFWIIIPGIFLLGAILGGIVFYQRGVSKGQTETPTPTPTTSVATPAASASPSATVDLTKYTVNILNGSGIVGEAGKVKDLLTIAGFKVGTTGNATTYDYTKSVIKAKSTVGATFLVKLSTSMGKSYLMDTNQVLATSSASDVQVIVGSSKAQ